MPRITKISHKPEKERFWVYVDGNYCTSIRARIFPALNLSQGQEITCDAVKELENFHWKNVYGQAAWDKEKVRLDKVKMLIESLDSRVKVDIVGFGANTNEFISEHPKEAGKPDLEVNTKNGSVLVLIVEVTGTEVMRGDTYWVRPDKLSYAKNHQDQDVWLILHYAQPQEKFVFIKPNLNTDYIVSKIEIRGSIEHYVEFTDLSNEVVSQAEFAKLLSLKVDSLGS